MSTIFDDNNFVSKDLALIIDKLVPEAQYTGSTDELSKEVYDDLGWVDERPKPSWNSIKNGLEINQFFILRKSVFVYRLINENLLDAFLEALPRDIEFIYHSVPAIESDHPFAKRLKEIVELIGGNVETIFAREDFGDYSQPVVCIHKRCTGAPFSISDEDLI